MSLESYQNDPAETTLNGAINNSTTTVTVTSGAALPATTNGPFRIRIDDEYMKVTTRSTNTLTVVRGDDGSTAASHSDGAAVLHVLTTSGLIGVGSHVLRTGAYSARPAAGVANRLYLPSDASVISLDDGSTWGEWGPIYKFTPPASGDFSWQNQGDAVVTDHGWAFTLEKPADGGTTNWRSRIKSTPATPWTLTACFDTFVFNKSSLAAGLVLRESSTGKLHFFGWSGANNTVAEDSVAGDTTELSLTGGEVASMRFPPRFWRITDNGTNLIFQWSLEGIRWFTQISLGRLSHMTATGPNQFGVTVNARNNATPNFDMALTLYHWAVT